MRTNITVNVSITVDIAGLAPGLSVRIVDVVPRERGNRRRPASPPCLVVEVGGIEIRPGDLVLDEDRDEVNWSPEGRERLGCLLAGIADPDSIDTGLFWPDGGIASVRVEIPIVEEA